MHVICDHCSAPHSSPLVFGVQLDDHPSSQCTDVFARVCCLQQALGYYGVNFFEKMCMWLGCAMPGTASVMKMKEKMFDCATELAELSMDNGIARAAAKCAEGMNLSVDGQWHCRGWTALSHSVECVEQNTGKVVAIASVHKSEDPSKAASSHSGYMEPLASARVFEQLKDKKVVLASLTKDGDSKVLASVAKYYDNVVIYNDFNHVQKNVKKKLVTECSEGREWSMRIKTLCGRHWTVPNCKSYVKRFAQRAYNVVAYGAQFEEGGGVLEDGDKRRALEAQAAHYFPKDAEHSECRERHSTYCPVAFATEHDYRKVVVYPVDPTGEHRRITTDIYYSKLIAAIGSIKPGFNTCANEAYHRHQCQLVPKGKCFNFFIYICLC